MFMPDNLNVFLYHKATDMRKSIDGLCALATEFMLASPVAGNLFIFFNKGRDKIKALYWERNGFCLFYKRLEKGRFKVPSKIDADLTLTMPQLRWLLDGLNFLELKGHPSLNYDIFC